MKFTDEAIALCKEIANYYQKPIDKYDPVIANWSNVDIIGLLYSKEDGRIMARNQYFYPDKIIPLWTFEDAREWLGEKGEIGILILRYQLILRKKQKKHLTTILVQRWCWLW